MKFHFNKILKTFFSIFIPIFFVGSLVLALAFANPTQTPPGGNAYFPLTLNTVEQVKEGALAIGGIFEAIAIKFNPEVPTRPECTSSIEGMMFYNEDPVFGNNLTLCIQNALDDYEWTLLDFENTDTLSVQSDIASIGSGDLYVDIAIDSVDMEKAFVLLSSRISGESIPGRIQFSGTLTSETNLRISRNVSGTAGDVAWQVVELPDATVQRGEIAFTTQTSLTDSISTVDLSKSFIIVQTRSNSTTLTELISSFWRGTFNSSTEVGFDRDDVTAGGDIAYQVVTLDMATVQSGNVSLNGVNTITENISPIVMSKSLLMFSNSSNNTGLGLYRFRGNIIDTTTLSFDRTDITDINNIEYFVVEHPYFDIQRGNTSLSAVDTVQTQAITETGKNTFVFASWDNTGTESTNANAFLGYWLSNNSEISFQKASSSQTHTAEWQVVNYTLNPPWYCGADIIDSRDNQTYSTIQIGDQCWMQENLNYDDGCSSVTWVDNSDEGWCGCYDNSSTNCDTYGLLYQWSAAMDSSTTEGAQGICPDGWHVPTDAEQHTLDNYLATGTCDPARNTWDCDPAGTKMRTSAWEGGDNSSGFTALAGGYCDWDDGLFYNLGWDAKFWSSSSSGGNAWHRVLSKGYSTVWRLTSDQARGFSVRCLRN